MALPTTIYDCCMYLHWCEFLSGCTAFCSWNGRLRINIGTRLYAIGTVCVFSGSMCYTTTKLVSDPANVKLLDNGMVRTLMVLTVASSVITYIQIALKAQFKALQLLQLYGHINLIDRQFERDFQVQLNYNKLQRNHRIICWLKVIFIIVYTTLPLALVRRSSNMGIVMLGQISYSVITFGLAGHTWAHINFAEILRIRARLLQKLLRKYKNYRAIELLKELNTMIEEINSIYANSNASVVTYDFVLTTYGIYVSFSNSLASISRYLLFYYYGMCMIASVVRIIIRPIIFQLAVKEFKKCFDIVARIDCNSDDERSVVSETLNWRLHHKHDFQIGYKTTLYNSFNILIITQITKLFTILNEIEETLFRKNSQS